MTELDREIFLIKRSLKRVKEDWLRKKGEKILNNLEKFSQYIKESENIGKEFKIFLEEFLKSLAVYEKSLIDFLEEYIFFMGFVESFFSSMKLSIYDESLRDETVDTFEKIKSCYFRMKYYFKIMVKSFKRFRESLLEIENIEIKKILLLRGKFEKAVRDLKKISRYLDSFEGAYLKVSKIYENVLIPIEEISGHVLSVNKEFHKVIKKNAILLKTFGNFIKENRPITVLEEMIEENKINKDVINKYRSFTRKIFILSYRNLLEISKILINIKKIEKHIVSIGSYYNSKLLIRWPKISEKIKRHLDDTTNCLREIYNKVREKRKLEEISEEISLDDIYKALQSYHKDILGIIDIINYINSILASVNESNYERYYNDILNAFATLRSYNIKDLVKEYSDILGELRIRLSNIFIDIESVILNKIEEDITTFGFIISLIRVQRKMIKRLERVEKIEERLKRYFKRIEEIEKIEVQEKRIKKFEIFLLDLENRYAMEVERIKKLKKLVINTFKKSSRIYPKTSLSKVIRSINSIVNEILKIPSKITPIESKIKRILRVMNFRPIKERISLNIRIDVLETRKDIYNIIRGYLSMEKEILTMDFGIYQGYIREILKEKERGLKATLFEILKFLYQLKAKQGR